MKNDPETLTIRPPEADDGSAIAHLFTQLGYPAEGGDVTARLLAPDPASVVAARLSGRQGGRRAGVAQAGTAACCTSLGPDLGAGCR